MSKLVLNIFPIGSIYMSVIPDNPSKYFSGTWVAWGTGRVPVSIDPTQTEFNTVEKTGGSKLLQNHSHDMDDVVYGGYLNRLGIRGDGGGNDGLVPNYSQTSSHSQYKPTSTGGGNSQNLQPYITCYMWKRTT